MDRFELDSRWQKEILDSLQGMAYGTVQIFVHDGHIVQIERTERKRFDIEKAISNSVDTGSVKPARRSSKPRRGT